MAELRNYNPSWREQIGAFASRLIGGGDETKDTAATGRKIAEGLDMIIGPATYGNDAYRSAQRGDYLGAAGNAAMGALSLPILPFGVSKTASLMGRSRYAPVKGLPEQFRLPSGEYVDSKPIPSIVDAAEDYMASTGRPHVTPSAFARVDPDRATRIAGAYDAAKDMPTDPATAAAYEKMAQETLEQYKALKNRGIEFRFMGRDADGNVIDPYAASPAMGYKDLSDRGVLEVFPTDAGFGTINEADALNPLLKQSGEMFGDQPATYNDLFRAVHDAFGHFGYGNAFFRAPGEERAWQLHSMMYSPEARRAMTSETRGQNSWLNYGPFAETNRTASGADTVFADQKVTLLPEWVMEEGLPPGQAAGAFRVPMPNAVAPSPAAAVGAFQEEY